jgi:hypothetical protein
MKPNDANSALSTDKRPFRVLIIAGSQRRQYSCPGVDSKARTLMLRMAAQLPQEWEIDYEDLGNVYSREQIQSCNACVSTSMALCVWPCNCYEKNSRMEPDLMWNLDLYARLDMADAWAIIGPANWFGPTSNIKLMFDRLVCMNGGNPREDIIKHKDPELAMKLEHTPEWEDLSINHLEGRTAAFFCYTDGGADDEAEDGRPKILNHKNYFDPDDAPYKNDRDNYQSIVWQCRYSGIEVPDHLWQHCEFGKGEKYSDNQAENMPYRAELIQKFDQWTDKFAEFISKKGKIEPGKYRAYGYRAPAHFIKDLRLGWRYIMMMIGKPPRNSSPYYQQKLKLNKDVTLHTKKGEGEKLRQK